MEYLRNEEQREGLRLAWQRRRYENFRRQWFETHRAEKLVFLAAQESIMRIEKRCADEWAQLSREDQLDWGTKARGMRRR
jgi:hypothetical protein